MSAGGPCDTVAGARPPLSGSADSVAPYSEYTETGDVVILVMELGFLPWQSPDSHLGNLFS